MCVCVCVCECVSSSIQDMFVYNIMYTFCMHVYECESSNTIPLKYKHTTNIFIAHTSVHVLVHVCVCVCLCVCPFITVYNWLELKVSWL